MPKEMMMGCVGFRHTEKSKAKMREVRLGKTHTEETRARMSLAHMGKTHTKETRAKMSRTRTGKTLTEETKAKLSRARMGRVLTEEHKAKLLQANLGKIPTEEARANMSKAQMGRTFSEETRAKMSKAQTGRVATEETKAKMRQAGVVHWQDPDYRDRLVRAMRLGCLAHPNKAEALLFGFIESIYPGEWKFVGDGQLIIAGKNPDFFNINSKKQIIELWGDYWHAGEDPQERIDLFKCFGFKTLVIWESELTQPVRVLEKIAEFIASD